MPSYKKTVNGKEQIFTLEKETTTAKLKPVDRSPKKENESQADYQARIIAKPEVVREPLFYLRTPTNTIITVSEENLKNEFVKVE